MFKSSFRAEHVVRVKQGGCTTGDWNVDLNEGFPARGVDRKAVEGEHHVGVLVDGDEEGLVRAWEKNSGGSGLGVEQQQWGSHNKGRLARKSRMLKYRTRG